MKTRRSTTARNATTTIIMTEPIIKLEDVWKRYKMGRAGDLTVLKEINFDIKHGEFVAINGPSGSGKSTIMHLSAHSINLHMEIFI